MITFRTIVINIAAILLSTASAAQVNKPVKDYLGVQGPVKFAQQSYELAWSSHPSKIFYKQEYLVKGDSADKFNSMILLDAITGASGIADVVAAKIAELKALQQNNPLVNYETMRNPSTGEYLLDFLLSANDAAGKLSIVERNVYRYKSVKDKNGKNVLLLFGISTRSYGNNIQQFLAGLKGSKQQLVNQVLQYSLPAIKVTD